MHHPSRSVAVVIPCYNQAHFLADAIESVLAQTHPDVELVVVDDGSPDDVGAVTARYPGVRCVRQSNQGLAAARNTGIRETRSPYLVFLDADDRLLPNALQDGLACIEAHPECAFVSGGFRHIREDGRPLGEPVIPSISTDHYVEMLTCSYIAMHATVLFRREILDQVHGYDARLRACEDFDLYLRIVREHPVCCHGAVVAEYRRHTANVSNTSALMLTTAVQVLGSQWPYVKRNPRYREAYRRGMRFWKAHYGRELIQQVKGAEGHAPGARVRAATVLLRLAPIYAAGKATSALRWHGRRAARAVLPAPVLQRLRTLRARGGDPPPVGHVALGDLARVTPISRVFGFDRGLPVDRYYIEGFLRRHAADIHGRVLEIADNDYTVRFGGARVVRSDILHVHADNPRATFVGDLADAPHLPSDAFDCVILTQTLHLIYDVKAAIRTLHRILKPRGVLLLTTPGITSVEHGVRGNDWLWTFTHESIRRLLAEAFMPPNVHVEDHGNVFAAVAFLHGLALQEVSTDALDHHDSAYQVIVAARAVKPDVR
jgi:glycosyltransferase involved in cell wall biosynthesis/SAM-dependent methyltransferase